MCSFFKLRRNVVVSMVFLGIAISLVLRLNLSVAIVDMTKEYIVPTTNGSFALVKYFDWDSMQKGNVLSSFFYGYPLTQVIGGYLATIYGAVYVFGFAVGSVSMLTLLTPFCTNTSIYGLILLRVVEGLCQGVIYPSLAAILSKWSPPNERTKLLAIADSGHAIGSVVAFLTCGFVAHTFGWPYAFYIPGILGVVWYLMWYLYIANDPPDDPYISEHELVYIKGTICQKTQEVSYPWKSMFTSVSVWAIIVVSFTNCWSHSLKDLLLPMYFENRYGLNTRSTGTLLTAPFLIHALTGVLSGSTADYLRQKISTSVVSYPWKSMFTSVSVWAIIVVSFTNCWSHSLKDLLLPMYFENRYGLNTRSTGTLLTAPFLIHALTGVLSGSTADYLRQKISTSVVRRIFTCIGTASISASLIAVVSVNSPVIATIYLTVGNGFSACTGSGYWTNTMDLAPQYSGVIMGVTNTACNVASAISPNVAGYTVKNETISEWRILFFLGASLNAIGTIIYCIFMSGERQPWDLLQYEDTVIKQPKNSPDAEHGDLNKDSK